MGENFHPLFGGNIDVPSYIAFQETPLQTFWPAVMLAISVLEARARCERDVSEMRARCERDVSEM